MGQPCAGLSPEKLAPLNVASVWLSPFKMRQPRNKEKNKDKGSGCFFDTAVPGPVQHSPSRVARALPPEILAYHVLNRRSGRLPMFEKPGDYAAFERTLAEAVAQTRLRIAAYSLMPNHWHLLIWPRRDGELSEVLRWITVTHTQRWHAHHKTSRAGI
jgi:hypothetical protein